MESFETRVNKAFGSLGMSSSWRLSEEQPRLEVLRSQQSQEEEEEEEEEEDWCRGVDGMDFEGDEEEEGRKMRDMVGLDATLDFEEEEDEFDKAAFGLGLEGKEERLYMTGIREVDKKVVTSASLPVSLYDLKSVRRDARANHSAARARLEEDAREAAAAAIATASRDSEIAAADVDESMKSGSEARIYDQRSLSENLTTSPSEKAKSLKRVRFALDLEEGTQMNAPKLLVRSRGHSGHASKVPDHVRNPSKYTHYTLDSVVEDNDMSNNEAFKACNEILQNSLKEECSSLQEMCQNIQYIHRPGRACVSAHKSDTEETDQSIMPIRRSMCLEDCETEAENAAMSSDDSMDFKREESVQLTEEKKLAKPAKNYRSKREALDNMDMGIICDGCVMHQRGVVEHFSFCESGVLISVAASMSVPGKEDN